MTAVTSFGRGAPKAKEPFQAGLLPLAQKEELCRALLEEFGTVSIRERRSDHELIHACLAAPEAHRNQLAEPTASLNYDKLTYKCLGCGAKGGLLWFIATCRRCTSTEARAWLGQAAGIGGYVLELDNLLRYLDAVYDTSKHPAPIPSYSDRILAPWDLVHPYLTDPKADGGRGIPEKNVQALRIGYAERYRLDQEGHRTSERIVIPHFWRDELVGWQTRRLDRTDGTPKYLSSPDFPKEQTLYNYSPRNKRTLVVEAMLSVAQHYHAAPHMSATFGASVTAAQARLLAKHEKVVLFFDNDKAGWEAVEGKDTYWPNSRRLKEHTPGLGETLSRSTNVLVVENPYAADPGDMKTADVLALDEAAVPFSVWARPTCLRCYGCKKTVHDGLCEDPT